MATHEQPTLAVPEAELTFLPQLSKMAPDKREGGVCLYGRRPDYGKVESWLNRKNGLISTTTDAEKLGISPGRRLFGTVSGWQVEACSMEQGGQVLVSFKEALRGHEAERVIRVWAYNEHGFKEFTTREIEHTLFSGREVAIIPVPEEKGAKLPEDRGGIIAVPVSMLKNDQVRKNLASFLELRFMGR